MSDTIAIIGGGMAGLSCARRLKSQGLDADIFDKGRGPGGRMSTRGSSDRKLRFDHGAQYFTARHDDFKRELAGWTERGVVREWRARFARLDSRSLAPMAEEPRYVGAPTMNAVVAEMSRGLPVRWGVEVAPLERDGDSWLLKSADGSTLGRYRYVVSSAPAAQTARLLAEAPSVVAAAERVVMEPCWSVMVAFKNRLRVPFDAVYLNTEVLAWAARDSSKPLRASQEPECWVLHASPAWSAVNLELAADDAAQRVFNAFARLINVRSLETRHLSAHRWRYARTAASLGVGAFYDGDLQAGACGDWFLGRRVEDAWLSGVAIADAVVHAQADAARRVTG